MDGIRNIGIRAGVIDALTTETLMRRTTLDASGLTVAPGFIDLHQHGRMEINVSNYLFKAMDGVTTALDRGAVAVGFGIAMKPKKK